MKFKAYEVNVVRTIEQQGSFIIIVPEGADNKAVALATLSRDPKIAGWSTTGSNVDTDSIDFTEVDPNSI